ncbi:recombinase family protein, partial [Pseudomonas amygdali]|uniref:recombinase family protein n=1 Tax=Pseudomonas amygdali TaxID=47877 RepID=UPI000C06AEF1
DYLETFVSGYGKAIASCYMENASGSHADRPELIRLLKDARRGDVLLVESIDRLSRMDDQAWRSLKTAIDNRGIRIVSVDLPTSHQGMTAQSGDEFTDRMLAAINYMMIDMMAAIARKDYQQRRLRHIEKAKASGVYKGRPVDAELRNRVRELLAAGLGIRAVARHAACSTTTVMKVRDELAQR